MLLLMVMTMPMRMLSVVHDDDMLRYERCDEERREEMRS